MQTFCVNKEILSEMTEKESSLVNLEQHQMTIKVKAPDMSCQDMNAPHSCLRPFNQTKPVHKVYNFDERERQRARERDKAYIDICLVNIFSLKLQTNTKS